jgi:hypothetical protein
MSVKKMGMGMRDVARSTSAANSAYILWQGSSMTGDDTKGEIWMV